MLEPLSFWVSATARETCKQLKELERFALVKVEDICRKIGTRAPTLEVHGDPRTPWYMGVLSKAAGAFTGYVPRYAVKFPWSSTVYPVLGDNRAKRVETLRLLLEVNMLLSFLFVYTSIKKWCVWCRISFYFMFIGTNISATVCFNCWDIHWGSQAGDRQ